MGSARSLAQCVAAFLSWMEGRFRPGTIAFYRLYLERFAERLGDPPIDQVSRLDVESWSAKRNNLLCVCRFFRWAYEVAELVPRNPAAKVKVPRNGFRSRVLTRAERVIVRRNAHKSLRMASLAMEQTGCRPQELRSLTWEMIFPKPGPAAIAGNLGDGHHYFRLEDYKAKDRRREQWMPRVIPITPRLGRLLMRLRCRVESPTGVIFRSVTGRAWTPNGFRCAWRRLRLRLSALRLVDVNGLVPYLYRHTAATDLARSGISAHLLKEWMGHAKVETTARYCHFSIVDLLAIGRRPRK